MNKKKVLNKAIDNIYSLNPLQEGMLFYALRDAESTDYVLQSVFSLDFCVDVLALQNAVCALSDRYDALRTLIAYEGMAKPRQVVLKKREPEFLYADLSGQDRNAQVLAIASAGEAEVKRGFDLQKDTLLRFRCIKLSENEYKLIWTMHHIIVDGWCMSILQKDLMRFYFMFASGDADGVSRLVRRERTENSEYSLYVKWLENQDSEVGLKFWENYLQDFDGTADIKSVEIPQKTTQQMNKHGIRLSVSISKELFEISKRERVTISTILQTAWGILLQKYNCCSDVVFGRVVSGRNVAIPGIEKMIGLFANTIPSRVCLHSNETILELLHRQQKENIICEEMTYCSLADIQNRVQRTDMIKSLFAFENYYVSPETAQTQQMVRESSREQTNYAITVSAYQESSWIAVDILYDPNKYTKRNISLILKHYQNIIAYIASNLNEPANQITYVDNEETSQILHQFNDTVAAYPHDKTVMELFEEQVTRSASDAAIVFGERTLSYAELNNKVNQLAWKLREMGVQRGDFVAILPERSAETIIGICAILKAGAAYVPIDPGYPVQRIQGILEDCRPKLILTYRASVNTQIPVVDLTQESIWCGRTDNLPKVNEPQDVAYCIYTSGTTGRPKGVLIRHYSINNLVMTCDYVPFCKETRMIQTGQLVFDASTFEIWGTLLNGGILHIIQETLLLDAEAFKHYLKTCQINMQFITTALFNQYVSYDAGMFDDVKYIIFGGERASEPHVRMLLKRNPELRLTNGYGPTESTTFAVCYTAKETPAGTIPIGRPIRNTQIYILQGTQLCGIGVPGELCIAGTGLAKGYLNRPELTANKFADNPFGEGKLYRSGDLARWLPDGNIEFLERMDEQVKVRGFRIELAEIENVLRGVEKVKDCAVVVRGTGNGEKAICAYVVGGEELDLTAVREEMRRFLPEYMIPLYMQQIERIPLTKNGKQDKRALPQIEERHEKEYVLPRDETEEKVCQAFCKVLGVERIGIHDNFFENGGHSLKSAQLVNLLRGQITIKDVFEDKTAANIAKRIRGCGIKEPEQEITKTEKAAYYKMSDVQKRLFIFEQLDETKGSYHVPYCFHLEGNFDEARANAAFQKLIERHESLRTGFVLEEGEFRQIVHEEVPFSLEHIKAEEIEKTLEAFLYPYDLAKAPLFRAAVAENESQWLLLDFHHLIVDGFSVELLLREFEQLYNGAELETAELQYRDYSAWMEKRDLSEQKKFWQESFRIPVPENDLPLDFKRVESSKHEGVLVEYAIEHLQQEEVERFCARQEVTPYVFFTSVLSVMLGRYYDSEDVTVGTPVSCRTHSDTEKIVGMFVNTVPIRSYPAGLKPFTAYLQEVKQFIFTALSNQEYPYNRLIEELEAQRALGRNPLFDVFFNYFDTNTMGTLKGEGFAAEQYEVSIGAGKFDLVFDVVLREGSYKLVSNYNCALFKGNTVERMLRHFANLIRWCLEHAEEPLVQAQMLSEAESRQLLEEFQSKKAYDENVTFPDMLRRTAEAFSEKTALVCGTERMSYGALNKQTDAVASALLRNGVGRGEVVGVLAEPGFAAFVGAIGTMKAGAAYMPIDPQYPEGRIRHMLQQSQCKLVLQETGLDLSGETAVLEIEAAAQGENETLPEIRPDDLAYVIFTSGSTGSPKGVMIEHRSLANLIFWHNAYYQITPKDKTTKYAGFGFDASVHEMYPQLAAGAEIHIIPQEMRMDLPAIKEYIERSGINVGFFPTPVCEQFAKQGAKGLEKVITGGDKLKSYSRDYTIYNNYGPTEGTVLSTVFEVNREYDNIPIGKPIDNVTVYIVNKLGQLQPVGLPGELWLAGKGLARGYINDAERTQERFGEDPFQAGGRIYKTGDLGRWLPDGNIEYLGRNDEQVKVRGNRVELGEIESIIAARCGVADCAAIVEASAGTERIALFYTAPEAIDTEKAKALIGQQLPRYMIPDIWVRMDALPLTPNAKVDKKALQQFTNNMQREYTAPGDDIERQLCNAFASVLGIERVGVDDSFFECGGHSLKIAQLLNEIEQSVGVRLTFRTIFLMPTVSELAQKIKLDTNSNREAIPQAERKEKYTASFVQKNIYIAEKRMNCGTAYNMPMRYKMEGKLDFDKLQNVVNALVQRYELLRTSFHTDGGEIYQKIHKDVTLYVEQLDVNDAEDAFARFVRPFDLSVAPLMRVAFVDCGQEQMLFLDVHHIIADGASMPLFLEDMALLYNEAALPEIQLQYKDFSEWLRNKDLQVAQSYWQEKQKTIGELPEFPTDMPGEAATSAFLCAKIEPKLYRALQEKARLLNTTLHNVLLYAAMVTVHKYCGQEQTILGVPFSMRSHANLANIPGMMVNVLPVICNIGKEARVAEQIKHVEAEVLAADQHSLCNVQELLNAEARIRVVFSYESISINTIRMENTVLKSLDSTLNAAKYDIVLGVSEKGTDYHASVSFARELFYEETAQSILESYMTVLQQICCEDRTQRITAVSPEQKRYLQMLAGTLERNDDEETVLDLIEKIAADFPMAPAIVESGKTVTYGEMMRVANSYAHCLSRRGIGRGDIVCILKDSGLDAIISILGICKTGAAYLPIDPHTPDNRIAAILASSGCKYALTDEKNQERIRCVQRFIPQDAEDTDELFHSKATPKDRAYVIYTSGSTGTPKGVSISHSALRNLVRWHIRQFELTCNDVTTRYAGFSFDASVWEIFPSLAVGVCIHVIAEDIRLDVKALNAYYNNNHISVSFLPTPVCEQFMKQNNESLRILLTGGDKLNQFTSGNRYRLFNNYGPTENTVVSTSYEVRDAAHNIPIGRPIDQVQAFVTDAACKLLPPYARGELLLGGENLAMGYLHEEELTKAAFVQTEFGRLYRTGDIVRWNRDGVLEFLGRRDDQVKINGNRIELGEIESTLNRVEGVTGAAATISTWNGNKWIVAYYSSEAPLSEEILKETLATSLPPYMVPRRIFHVDIIPLTLNGKIDKKALPLKDLNDIAVKTEAVSATEKLLTSIWQSILGQKAIGIHDNFMEIGGNSILVVKMHDEIERLYPDTVGISDIFANPTIAMLTRHIEKKYAAHMIVRMKGMAVKNSVLRSGASREIREYSIKEGNELCQLVEKLKTEDKELMQMVLMSACCYTLDAITESDTIDLSVVNENRYSALSVERTKDLAELTDCVAKAYRMAEKVLSPKVLLDRKRGSTICAFALDSDAERYYRDSADLYLSCSSKNQQLYIRIESRKLTDNALKVLLQHYHKVLNVIFGID